LLANYQVKPESILRSSPFIVSAGCLLQVI
jgi:hypothetical protein